MKTFVLIVSKTFPVYHKKSGQDTGFVYQIQNIFTDKNIKIHTIRSNYTLWKSRENEINNGRAILSIRYWSGKPYASKQVEICRLTEIGVQILKDPSNFVFAEINNTKYNWEEVAHNDGLSFEDFCEWFKKRQSEPMAVIQFTKFRY